MSTPKNIQDYVGRKVMQHLRFHDNQLKNLRAKFKDVLAIPCSSNDCDDWYYFEGDWEMGKTCECCETVAFCENCIRDGKGIEFRYEDEDEFYNDVFVCSEECKSRYYEN